MKLQDRVALVTGAASGIAQAVAARFAAEGAAVMAADTDDKNGRETVERIRAAGGRAEFFHLDVSSSDQVRQAVQQTIASLGGLHILFNGAGILAYGTAVETSEELWSRVMAVNLTGTFLCSHACLPHMIAQGNGSVINVASTTGAHDACAHAVAYVSSKGGVTLLTRAMAIDHARQGVRVNAICPGPTDTPMLRKALTQEQLEAFAKTFPMGRLGRPEELAGAAVYLASDDASFVTGALLYVDGGQTAEV
ncbi:MAG: SDR family NAD(P)-dependent oxidoreductase [Terracidiphilus sp.]|jgi:NAD(P)-dependent dehydrogenase (short-subunit alcohol dehydrogenase family)